MEVKSGLEVTIEDQKVNVSKGVLIESSLEYPKPSVSFRLISGEAYVQVDDNKNIYYSALRNPNHFLLTYIESKDAEEDTEEQDTLKASKAIDFSNISILDIPDAETYIDNKIQEIETSGGVTVRLENIVINSDKITTSYTVNSVINIYIKDIGEIELNQININDNIVEIPTGYNGKTTEILYI